VIDGYAVVEGDIIIGRPEDFPGVPVIPLRGGGGGFGESDRERRWPRGFVPFVIHPFVPDQHRITDAMRHWENVTSIRFGQRTTETDFVLFTRGTECMSKVGRRGEQQQIIMSDLCSTGNLIHEIGHCVGLHHEHTRNDRDTFVEILWNNITEGMEDQFELGSPDDWDIGPYDYGSIMHYRTTAFGKSGMGGVLETIRILGTVPPGVTVGQRTALSAGDMAAVSFLYDQWQDWTRIDTGFSIPTRSPVTSLSRFPEHLDIFVIGTDGRVWSNFWNETSNNGFWNSWFPIGPDSSFPAQEIAAVSRHDNNIDLFVVGHDGVVYSAFWNPADEPARLLEIISPGGFVDFFRGVGELAAAGPPDPALAFPCRPTRPLRPTSLVAAPARLAGRRSPPCWGISVGRRTRDGPADRPGQETSARAS
jgi:hypothetical protein